MQQVNAILGKTLGVQLRRSRPGTNRQTPIPLVVQTLDRVAHFQDLLGQIEHVDGDIVECGVGWGRSLFILAGLSRQLPFDRKFYGFDSFQGFPEPTAEDAPESNSKIAAGHYATKKQSVLNYLLNSGIEKSLLDTRVDLVSGWFEDSLPGYDGQIALLHLDCDLYQSYLTSLELLYPKMVPGGIIAFDEYGKATWTGATKAIDEFFSGKPESIVKSKHIQRYYIVKA